MNGISTRALTWAALSLATIAAFLLLKEQWGHALGFLPYAILLACPLMHLFHGHGGHGGSGRAPTSDHSGHEEAQKKRDGA